MSTVLEQAKALRATILKMATTAPDADVLELPRSIFDDWIFPCEYEADKDIVRYSDGELYKCSQSHTSQSDWTPDISHSLWIRIEAPAVEFPKWRQPLGSTDAYKKGAKVSHKEKHWVSDEDNNVWEPGVYGWTEVKE